MSSDPVEHRHTAPRWNRGRTDETEAHRGGPLRQETQPELRGYGRRNPRTEEQMFAVQIGKPGSRRRGFSKLMQTTLNIQYLVVIHSVSGAVSPNMSVKHLFLCSGCGWGSSPQFGAAFLTQRGASVRICSICPTSVRPGLCGSGAERGGVSRHRPATAQRWRCVDGD